MGGRGRGGAISHFLLHSGLLQAGAGSIKGPQTKHQHAGFRQRNERANSSPNIPKKWIKFHESFKNSKHQTAPLSLLCCRQPVIPTHGSTATILLQELATHAKLSYSTSTHPFNVHMVQTLQLLVPPTTSRGECEQRLIIV